MSIVESFKSEIEAFMKARGLTATAFGTDALGDPSFVPRLFSGKHEPRLSTIEKVRSFMESEAA